MVNSHLRGCNLLGLHNIIIIPVLGFHIISWRFESFCEICICSFHVPTPPYWLSIHQDSSHGILLIFSHSTHWGRAEELAKILSFLFSFIYNILLSWFPRFTHISWLEPTKFHILIQNRIGWVFLSQSKVFQQAFFSRYPWPVCSKPQSIQQKVNTKKCLYKTAHSVFQNKDLLMIIEPWGVNVGICPLMGVLIFGVLIYDIKNIYVHVRTVWLWYNSG